MNIFNNSMQGYSLSESILHYLNEYIKMEQHNMKRLKTMV